ncbi:MAG: DUF3726 domain-containing protein, partial [Pseudomonadota bacterium]
EFDCADTDPSAHSRAIWTGEPGAAPRRAARRGRRGAGLDWGEAEEAGWAASWLSRAGLSGPRITLAWLIEAARLARPAPAPDLWAAASDAQCPLRCGIALADFAGLPEGPGARPLTVERVAHPLMLLPFVARATVGTGSGLRIRWGAREAVLTAADIPLRLDLTGDEGPQVADLAIAPVDPHDLSGMARGAPPQIPGVSCADWRALDTLALRVTVPASRQSRTGAGAAGTDND